MSFVNKEGKRISYECSELIEELKEDIMEFGGEEIVAVWCKKYEDVIVYTNYDFIEEEKPLNDTEIKDGEFLKMMTMNGLLVALEQQNSVV